MPSLPSLLASPSGSAVAVAVAVAVVVAFSAGQTPHHGPNRFEGSNGVALAVLVAVAVVVPSGPRTQVVGNTGNAVQYAVIAASVPAALTRTARALASSVLPAVVAAA